ncbi:MAG: hypothetical protein JWP75_1551, partial [Frondihabitans sp.]|nr:hypothetical protein [Frondihabitans sp.]
WRLPLTVLAALGAILAIILAVVVRDVPVGLATGLRVRLRVLRHGSTLVTLLAGLLLTSAFNVVYIFSSAATAGATGGSGTLLAILLLLFGVGGVVGNSFAGRLTDRLGSRAMASLSLGIQIVVLALTPLVERSYLALAIVFLVWGAAAFGAVIPVQHRLVSIDPAAAGIALSWYSTAMYVGIALAPVLGAAVLNGAIGLPGSAVVPLVGAGLSLLAVVLFLLGFTAPRGLRRVRQVDVRAVCIAD